jgi:hypothetical protein
MLKVSIAKLSVVVNLAVENNMDRPVVVAHRLCSGISRIEDRQAAMGEKSIPIMKDTFSIRTTMSHRLSHILTQYGVRATIKRTFARDPTHYQLIFVSGVFISHPVSGFIGSWTMSTGYLNVFDQ